MHLGFLFLEAWEPEGEEEEVDAGSWMESGHSLVTVPYTRPGNHSPVLQFWFILSLYHHKIVTWKIHYSMHWAEQWCGGQSTLHRCPWTLWHMKSILALASFSDGAAIHNKSPKCHHRKQTKHCEVLVQKKADPGLQSVNVDCNSDIQI